MTEGENFHITSYLPNKWFFTDNPADKTVGYNKGSNDEFAGQPHKSLAREICQNSLDVPVDSTKPVVVEFHSFDISPDIIPGIDQLKDALKKESDYFANTNKNNNITKEFTANAVKELSADKVTCLRISDFNTTGVTGSDKRKGSNWANLIKGEGNSDKESSQGGSKGMGKIAAFVVSNARTVFYSTSAIDGKEAYEGVTDGYSYYDDPAGEKPMIGSGYFSSSENFCPAITGQLFLDPSFRREKDCHGTDIYIIAYRKDKNWKNIMAGSVVDSFLCAINDGKLEVHIEDIVINKDTLADVIKGLPKKYIPEHSDEYYDVLTDELTKTLPEHEFYGDDNRLIGSVTLKILLHPNYSRTCAMIRSTGMKIMDMKGISTYIVFSAVCLINGNLNGYLRELENGRHTEWSTYYLQGDVKQKEAERVLQELKDYIIQSVSSMSTTDGKDAVEMNISRYLSLTKESDGKDNGEGVITDDIDSISTSIAKAGSENDGTEGNGLGFEESDDGDADRGDDLVPKKPKDPSNPPTPRPDPDVEPTGGVNVPPENGKGDLKIVEIASSRRHAFCVDSSKGLYKIVFTPKKTEQNAFLTIAAAAESTDYDADLLYAEDENGNKLKTSENAVYGLSFTKGKPVTISIALKDCSDRYALEVKGHAYKK